MGGPSSNAKAAEERVMEELVAELKVMEKANSQVAIGFEAKIAEAELDSTDWRADEAVAMRADAQKAEVAIGFDAKVAEAALYSTDCRADEAVAMLLDAKIAEAALDSTDCRADEAVALLLEQESTCEEETKPGTFPAKPSTPPDLLGSEGSGSPDVLSEHAGASDADGDQSACILDNGKSHL